MSRRRRLGSAPPPPKRKARADHILAQNNWPHTQNTSPAQLGTLYTRISNLGTDSVIFRSHLREPLAITALPTDTAKIPQS